MNHRPTSPEDSLLPVRMVVPAFRAERTILRCIEALVNSKGDFERSIVVSDNGGNPNLHQLLAKYPVQIIDSQKVAGAAYARNKGAEGFHEGILVFVDADVVCEPHAIEHLIRPLQELKADASVGNYSSNVEGLGFAQKYKQLYIHRIYSRRSGLIENEFWTALGAIRADLFVELGGFDLQFKGACGEDMELGIRISKNGHLIKAVPHSKGKHLHYFTFNSILKNDYKKGTIAVCNSLSNHISITGNRHSKARDMVSVFCANSFLLIIITIPLFSLSFGWGLFPTLLLLVTWIWCRSDLLKLYFNNQGIIFGIRAALFMYLLDIVRACSLLSGILKWKFQPKETGTAFKNKHKPQPEKIILYDE